MLQAIIQHTSLLMTLRHPGTGLPDRGSFPWILLAGAATTTIARAIAEGMDLPMAIALALLGSLIIAILMRRRLTIISALAMICMAGDLVAVLSAGLSFGGGLMLVVTTWQFVAMMYFVRRNPPTDARS